MTIGRIHKLSLGDLREHRQGQHGPGRVIAGGEVTSAVVQVAEPLWIAGVKTLSDQTLPWVPSPIAYQLRFSGFCRGAGPFCRGPWVVDRILQLR